MIELDKMEISDLINLKAKIESEILRREANNKGFDLIIEIGGKPINPCTYNQYKFIKDLSDKTSSKIEPVVSQITKRMSYDQVNEAIDAMRNGKRILIK